MSESALVILVPVAEPLVRPYRARFDSSAAAGLGAHITLLYPFADPEKIGESDLDSLAECTCRLDNSAIRRPWTRLPLGG